MAEFLPLCDVLFNVISLAGYFCDVVFDVVMGYALLERGYKGTFAAAISIVLTSLLVSQILSLRWYLHVTSGDEERKGKPPWVPILLHCFQLGVLWRYAKLFVPVDLRNVKHEVRDLCMLRLVHAFCEAAPMLLLQIHVLFEHESITSPVELITRDSTFEEAPAGSVTMTANKAFAELNVISASLSMFSVCWALASFSKNVRQQNVHRLVLTWLGVIFQFLWRLGTISARICALSAYALVYKYWIFLVIGLHWISMFLWLISPKNVFHGERISQPRKAYLSALIAFVYVFAYINLQELNHRQKMVTFYSVMLLENCVLVFACACAWPLAAACFGASASGLMFMALYYRYFHVRRLGYTLGENQQGTNSTNASSQSKHANKMKQADNAAIPGVFNCRFTNPVGNNSSNGRKRKKPSSFVPPPAPPPAAFWRTPLPHVHHGGSSENEGSSVGSRVNIQQKLQEKKQKQLAELRIIEEEFKQGKLTKTTPVPAEEIYCSLQRQPIPRSKTHADPQACLDLTHSYQNYPILPHNCDITYPQFQENNDSKTDIQIRPIRMQNNSLQFYDNTTPDIQRNILTNYLNENSRNVLNGSGRDKCGENGRIFEGRYNYGELSRRCVRCRTPEVLLAPHYLDCGRPVCCHWGNSYKKKEEGEVSSGSECVGDPAQRPHSDIESQISLPRSYTLPREFRYWRRRTRRDDRERSNNSSDGDVDSAGDNDSDGRSLCSDTSQVNRIRTPERRNLCGPERARRLPYRKHVAKPETKL